MKIKTALVRKRILSITQAIQKEKDFLDSDAGRVASYFKAVLKSKGFVLTPADWTKLLDEVQKTFTDDATAHITAADWLACIDWSFSPEKAKDDFWGKFVVKKFSTVVKIYNTFHVQRLHKQSKQHSAQMQEINYGRL